MFNVMLAGSSDVSTTLYRTPRFKHRLYRPRRVFLMLGSKIIGFPSCFFKQCVCFRCLVYRKQILICQKLLWLDVTNFLCLVRKNNSKLLCRLATF